MQRVALLLQGVQPRLQRGTSRRRRCSLLLSKLSCGPAGLVGTLQLRNPGQMLRLLLLSLRLLLPVLRFEVLSQHPHIRNSQHNYMSACLSTCYDCPCHHTVHLVRLRE